MFAYAKITININIELTDAPFFMSAVCHASVFTVKLFNTLFDYMRVYSCFMLLQYAYVTIM